MRHFDRLRRVVVGSLLVGLASVANAQTTWYVDASAVPPGNGTQAAPYPSIQYAIDRPTTLSRHTLLVAPGLYVENVKDNSKTVVVRSTQGPLVTELRPLNLAEATVYCTHGSTVEGFTLTGNPSNHLNGGALDLEGSTALRCDVRDDSGLGVFSHVATLKDCTIVGPGPCARSCTFALGACLASGAYPALVAGSQAYCQWWNRDPLDPAGFGSGLSNGLVFGVAP